MVLTAFDPFRELDRAFRNAPAPAPLAMDAIRREHEVEIKLDLPGYTPEEVDVTIERNVLTVTASHSETVEQKGDTYLTRERRSGSARRQIVLSDVLDGSRIEASMDHGVLHLIIPVSERAKPQKVSVNVGSPRSVAIDTAATETPATETPATDTPAAETPAADTPAADTPAAETPAAGS